MQLKLRQLVLLFTLMSLYSASQAQSQNDVSRTDGTANNPPDCVEATEKLHFTVATKTWDCKTDQTGAGGGLGYVLSFVSGSLATPADSTTYYVGDGTPVMVMQTIWTNARAYIHKAGTVKSYFVRPWSNSTWGTNETVNYYLRLNDTTDFGNATAKWDSIANAPKAVTGLTQAVAAGDYLAFKVATPAWVTNPSQISVKVTVYIE